MPFLRTISNRESATRRGLWHPVGVRRVDGTGYPGSPRRPWVHTPPTIAPQRACQTNRVAPLFPRPTQSTRTQRTTTLRQSNAELPAHCHCRRRSNDIRIHIRRVTPAHAFECRLCARYRIGNPPPGAASGTPLGCVGWMGSGTQGRWRDRWAGICDARGVGGTYTCIICITATTDGIRGIRGNALSVIACATIRRGGRQRNVQSASRQRRWDLRGPQERIVGHRMRDHSTPTSLRGCAHAFPKPTPHRWETVGYRGNVLPGLAHPTVRRHGRRRSQPRVAAATLG